MRFIFTDGSQRSGTTLLQKFLCLDSTTAPKLTEASYLRMLVQACSQDKDDFDKDGQPRYQPWITDNNDKDINNSSIGRDKSVLTATKIEQANQHYADILQLVKYS